MGQREGVQTYGIVERFFKENQSRDFGGHFEFYQTTREIAGQLIGSRRNEEGVVIAGRLNEEELKFIQKHNDDFQVYCHLRKEGGIWVGAYETKRKTADTWGPDHRGKIQCQLTPFGDIQYPRILGLDFPAVEEADKIQLL